MKGLPPELTGSRSFGVHKGILATPDRFNGYARLSMTFRSMDRAGLAGLAVRRAMMIAPGEPRLHINAANLWLSTGVAGNPEPALRRALCLDPGLSAAADRLLLLRGGIGDRAGAERLARWNTCRNHGERVGPLLELALLVNDAGDPRTARQILFEAFKETVLSEIGIDGLVRAARRIGGEETRVQILAMLLILDPVHSTAAAELASTPEIDGMAKIDSVRSVLPRLAYGLPLIPVVQNGAGVVLERRGRTESVLHRYKKAATLDPGLSIAIFNVGVRTRYAGNFPAAARLFKRALAIDPRDPIYKYNLGHARLATGQAEEGLALYEERWRSGQKLSHRRAAPEPSFPQRIWDETSSNRDGQTVLIWGEQGLGDEIWFAGYAGRLFTDRRTVLECDPRLTGLFTRSKLADTVIPREDPPRRQAIDAAWQIAAGSLPLLENKRLAGRSPPAPRGYLKPETRRMAELRGRLESFGRGPTIGISWRSRKQSPNQSFQAALELWRPVLEIPNATFVNLQYDADETEFTRVRDLFGITLERFPDIDPLYDIDGLAALIAVLDHVVSIANVNVALCHGIGRSCHVALRHYQEDWRFQRQTEATPWLPDCKLYWPEARSPTEGTPDGEWQEIFPRIAAALK